MITINGTNYYDVNETNILGRNETDLYLFYVTEASSSQTVSINYHTNIYQASVATYEGKKIILMQYRNTSTRTQITKVNCVLNYSINSSNRTFNFTVAVGASVNSVFPIWRDYFLSFEGRTAPVNYEIRVGSTVLYRGVASAIDGVSKFKLNDVCRNYLEGNIDLSGLFVSPVWQDMNDAKKSFDIWVSTSETSNPFLFATVTFSNDWSYYNFTGNESSYLSDPIIPIVDIRQLFLFTSTFNSGSAKVYINGNQVSQRTFSGQIKTFIAMPTSIGPGIGDGSIINFNNWKSYTLKETCNRYCLYYLNAHGGWDWLVIDGNTVKNYGYSRQNYLQNYDNTTLEPGKVNFKNDIKESWNLTTGFLTDSQSSKMYNLFGSVNVYLHDLEENKITPVVITNTAQEEKTFQNQGRKFYNYTITVESAQNKIRM